MDLHESDVVGMSFPLFHFLHGVVIIHSQLHVICRCYEPLLSGDEFSTSHRDFTQLKAFNQSLQEHMERDKISRS